MVGFDWFFGGVGVLSFCFMLLIIRLLACVGVVVGFFGCFLVVWCYWLGGRLFTGWCWVG